MADWSGGSGRRANTARTNRASQRRYEAQGRAYKASGQLSADGKTFYGRPNPQAALEAWLASHDTYDTGGGGGSGGGGGGGGGGGYDYATYDAGRANAEKRYGEQRGQLDDLYGDYAKAVAGNPAATKKMYDTLIANGKSAGEGIAKQATAQANKQEAQRNSGLASLGVSEAAINASPSETKLANQQGLQDLAKQNSSWGNLQGVLGAAQQTRDRLDIQGVNDAKVLAQRQLTQNYEDFMRQLDAQLMASYSGGGGGGGYSGGGGGGSSEPTNKYRGKLEDAIFNQLLTNAGYKGSSGGSSSNQQPRSSTKWVTQYDSERKPIGYTKTTTR